MFNDTGRTVSSLTYSVLNKYLLNEIGLSCRRQKKPVKEELIIKKNKTELEVIRLGFECQYCQTPFVGINTTGYFSGTLPLTFLT